MYRALYGYFVDYLSEYQHCFVRRRSVLTNMISFLKRIYEAVDINLHDEIMAFYSDFCKAFDRVPHFELLKKVAEMVVRGCFLELLYDYLKDRKQNVRLETATSKTLNVTRGVPQGSLLGTLLFCIFINDLPEVLKFSSPFIFADDLKVLAIAKTPEEVQEEILAAKRWVKTNKMEPAVEKCAQIIFRESQVDHLLGGET